MMTHLLFATGTGKATLAVALIAAAATSVSLLGNLALLGTIIAAAVLFGGAVVKGFNWHSKRAVEHSKIDEVLLTLKKTGPDAQNTESVSDVLEHHGEVLSQIRNDYVGQEDHALLVNSVANAAAGLGRIETELASFKQNTANHRLIEESDNKTAREQIATMTASIAGLGTGLVRLEGSIQTLVQEYSVQKAHTDSVEESVFAQLIAQLEQFKSYVTRNEFSLLAEAVQRIEAIDNAQLELQKSFATRTELAVLTEVVKRLEAVVTNVVTSQTISGEQARVELVRRAEEGEQVKVVAQETVAARTDITHRLDELEGPVAHVIEVQQHIQDNRFEGLETTSNPTVAQVRIDSAKPPRRARPRAKRVNTDPA